MACRHREETRLLTFADTLLNQCLRLEYISQQTLYLDERHQLKALGQYHHSLAVFLFSSIKTRITCSVHVRVTARSIATSGSSYALSQQPFGLDAFKTNHYRLVKEGKQHLEHIQTPELRLALSTVLSALLLSEHQIGVVIDNP